MEHMKKRYQSLGLVFVPAIAIEIIITHEPMGPEGLGTSQQTNRIRQHLLCKLFHFKKIHVIFIYSEVKDGR